MHDAIDALIHDAASLHRLVDFIHQYCNEQRTSQTYVDATDEFFGYIDRLATGTKEFLRISTQSALLHRADVIRTSLLSVKNYWRVLHTFIKPAADAHTLKIPSPLLNLAAEQVRQVPGMQGANVVVLLTPELMYFQMPHSDIKDAAINLSATIPEARFPRNLGFVELPYSQGPSFFNNLVIYHEIGHFVYEELSNADPPVAALDGLASEMIRCLQKNVNPDFDTLDRNIQVYAITVLQNWVQEVFCDLFAIRLIGPAFTFASVELFGLLGLMGNTRQVRFSDSHPAQACRFSEHLRQLQADGWWDLVKDIPAEQPQLVSTIANRPFTEYQLDLDGDLGADCGLIPAFLDLLPAIRDSVRSLTDGARGKSDDFRRYRDHIDRCLAHGVVPSAPTDFDNVAVPDPIAVINAAFCFYLSALPKLMGNLKEQQDPRNLEHRSKWTRRLEMWTMKAIEDFQIWTQCQAAANERSI